MDFTWPLMLWGLLLVPVAVAGYVLFQRTRVSSARLFTTAHLEPNLIANRPGWRRHVPALFYLLGMLCLLTGLARPQAALSVERERATVLFVLDTSRSMRAQDVAPSRIEVARTTADRLFAGLPQRFEVGVIGFSGRPQILSRPTTDRIAVSRALDSIDLRYGTAIGDALLEALEMTQSDAPSSDERSPTVAILLTDGNNNAGEADPVSAARAARDARMTIHTILMGRAQPVPGSTARPANSSTPARIAEITGGHFFETASEAELESAYEEIGSRITNEYEDQELTAAFVGAAALVIVVGGGISLRWFNRFP